MSVNARRFLEARSKSIEFKGELVAEGRSFDSAIVAKGAVSFFDRKELHNSEIPYCNSKKRKLFGDAVLLTMHGRSF